MVVIEPPEGTEPTERIKRFVGRMENICLASDTTPEEVADLTSEAVILLDSCNSVELRWLYSLASQSIDEHDVTYNAVMAAANHVVQEVFR